MELPGAHSLKDAQVKLDAAVRAAYGMGESEDPLAFLLELNHEVCAAERAGEPVQAPGLPMVVKDPKSFITSDCIVP